MNNLKYLITSFINNKDDESMEKLVDYFEQPNISNEEIAELAIALAESGNMVRTEGAVADIPSTGGPSSLTTLLCPLYLQIQGIKVLKLGVPGRPAGGIDVLACIPKYRVDFSFQEIVNFSKIDSCYFHFLASSEFAPLDAKLFSFRKRVGKINIPYLAIASILSKKIALGVNLVGLDVRASTFGNFGYDVDQYRVNSKKFVDVAKIFNITAVCYISNANVPYQPYIGRGEALLALDSIFNNKMDAWLSLHNEYCINISKDLAQRAIGFCNNDSVACNILDAFKQNLQLQGSSYNYFISMIDYIKSVNRNTIVANAEGYIYYNLLYIRTILVEIQVLDSSETNVYTDPVGIILLKQNGAYIKSCDSIISIRCKEKYMGIVLSKINNMFVISKEKTKIPESYLEVITNG